MAMSNPRRSGGPRTAAGRQAVAGNALRTGAYAAQVVLPSEDPADFQALEQQFFRDFAPADVAESALVHQLAVITWKKLRLDRIEHSHFLGLTHRPYMQLELEPVAHLLPLPAKGALEWVNGARHHTSAERDAILAALQLADTLVNVPADGYPPDTIARIKAQALPLYQHLQLESENYRQPFTEAEWPTTEVVNGDVSEGIFLAKCCDSFCELYADWYWVMQQRDAAEQALRQLQEKRILTSMQQGNLNRIHDDLDRAFQRTLGELRRQQNWRRDRATVTVLPESPPQPASSPSGM